MASALKAPAFTSSLLLLVHSLRPLHIRAKRPAAAIALRHPLVVVRLDLRGASGSGFRE
jgi:hypothetical protein